MEHDKVLPCKVQVLVCKPTKRSGGVDASAAVVEVWDSYEQDGYAVFISN